jgi:hypothetical protein
MSSNSNVAYALAAMTALALGLGASFWQSSVENKRLLRANLTAGIALETAQDEAKVLRERLAREIKAREFAEAAQTIAETSERGAREKLLQETKAKQGAEAARLEAEAQLETAALKLAQERETRIRTGAALNAANADLAKEREARVAAELRRDEAIETIAELTVKLDEENAAGNAVREALAEAEGQVRMLSTKLAGELAAREKAVIVKMQTVNAIAGSEAAKAADEAKDEANEGTSARSADVPNRIPAGLATREPEARAAPGPAPLIQANDLSRQNLVVQ